MAQVLQLQLIDDQNYQRFPSWTSSPLSPTIRMCPWVATYPPRIWEPDMPPSILVITPIDQDQVARIEATGATVRLLDPAERRALGGAEADPAVRARLDAALAAAEVLFGVGRLPADLLQRAPRLRWYQAMTAGVDRVPPGLLRAPDFKISSARGHNAGAVAEHVIWALLALVRGAVTMLDSQRAHTWARLTPGELAGRTLGIVGFGAIGEEVARRARPFGMSLIATRRSARAGDSHPLIDRLLPPDGLVELLEASDAVLIATPLTEETRGLIDTAAFDRMRTSAYLIDVSRGGVVDAAALVAALQSGRIAGAALDVTDPEPLSADSPLWDMPNVLITPHISGSSAYFNERAVDLFLENLHRYTTGQPLQNLVDPVRGY